MGYKCPVCFKDFEKNKVAWRKHIKQEHLGIGEDIRKFIREVTKKDDDIK